MSVGVTLVIAIAATGVLVMRFRKRWLAKINLVFTNRITSLFAGWLPGFGILAHVGHRAHLHQPMRVGEERPRSGRVRTGDSREETPAFRTEGRA